MTIPRAAAPAPTTPIRRRATSAVTILSLFAATVGIAAGLQLASASSGTISGLVFLDVDADGAFGAGDGGIEGVEVVAVDGGDRRTVPVRTAADGRYEVDLTLAAGEPLGSGPYRIEFAGWPVDLDEVPLGPDNGSSVQFATADETGVSLALGTGSPVIGNRVWLDLDRDGRQDAAEPGIAGVAVELRDPDGVSVGRAVTDTVGVWQVPVEPGTTASVHVDVDAVIDLPFGLGPDDLLRTTPAAIEVTAGDGADHSVDIGFGADIPVPTLTAEILVAPWHRPGTPVEYRLVVTNEGPGPVVAIGLVDPFDPACAIEPFALDPDASESWTCVGEPLDRLGPTVADVAVVGRWDPPYGPSVDVDATASVDLRVADPRIAVAASARAEGPFRDGDTVTYDVEVTNPGDVDLDLGAPTRLVVDTCGDVEPADVHPTAGAPFNVGDLDADGILDRESEVWRYTCTTVVDVELGDVDVVGRPLGTLSATATALATPVEPDGTPTGLLDESGQATAVIPIVVADAVEPLPAAVAPPAAAAALGDLVWHDLDGDGLLDDGEPGVEGVTVELLDPDGALVGEATTDADGAYLFSPVDPGVYGFRVVLPAGAEVSSPDRPASTTLDPGEVDRSWDVGLRRRGAVSGRVWLDGDGDGSIGPDELGIAGLVVELSDADGELRDTTATDGDGSYRFDGLLPGAWAVSVDVPAGHRAVPGDRVTRTLVSGASETVDVGLFVPAAVGGRAWIDADADGVQQDGEDGLGGVRVRLIDAVGSIAGSTDTADDGDYRFDDLAPGSYRLEFVTPAGMTAAPVDAGADDDLDSDLDPATGRTAPVLVESGRTADSWDAGFSVPTVVLSSPEVNTAATRLAITGRSVYALVALATLLVGLGGTLRILADRMRHGRLAPAEG